MLITTHLLATTVVLAISKASGSDIATAVLAMSLGAGVLLDLDHIIFHPVETVRHTRSFLEDPKGYQTGQAKNATPLHYPVSILPFLIVTLLTRFSFIPLLCYAIHLSMDALVFERKLLWPFSDKVFQNFLTQNIKYELATFVVFMPLTLIFLI
ncbi:MAG: hypothetical protein WC243_01830 [Patescibacteria group bacterium]|jgi:hypothetical protein